MSFSPVGLSFTGFRGRAQVTELDRGEDGGPEHDGGADGKDHMQSLGEGLAGHPDQDLPGLAG
jgi:hypothetical protein